MKEIRYNTVALYIISSSILYYILCCLSPITLCDDIIYKFVWPIDNESYVKPISNIKDLFVSQYIHYQVLNGRSIVHLILQLFDGILGKKLCNIISSIIFGYLIYMLSCNITQNKNSLFSCSLITATLFILIPGFHNEFLLFVGVFNYLWVSAATALFVVLINKHGEKSINVKRFCLSIFAFFVGWLHEGISVPISLTLIVYCTLHRKTIIKTTFFYCTIFYVLGTCMCLMAPGTMNRIGQYGGILQSLAEKVFLGSVNLLHLRISYLMLIISLVTFQKKKEVWKKHFEQYKYFYLTWFFTFIPIFGSGSTETRVIFYTEFIAMMISANLIIQIFQYHYRKNITICLNLLMLCLYGIVFHYSYKNHQNALFIEQQLSNPKISIVEVPQIRPADNYFLSEVFDNYVREPVKFGPFENAQGFVQDNTHIKCMKILYNKPQLYFLPQDILNKIKGNQIKCNELVFNKKQEMMVTQIQQSCTPQNIKLLLNKENINSLPFYRRKLAYKNDSYKVDKYYYDTLLYHKRKYLLVCCPTRNISRRIDVLTYQKTRNE